jgi:hypothetical protein
MTPRHCERERSVAGSNPVNRQILWIAAPSYDGSQLYVSDNSLMELSEVVGCFALQCPALLSAA